VLASAACGRGSGANGTIHRVHSNEQLFTIEWGDSSFSRVQLLPLGDPNSLPFKIAKELQLQIMEIIDLDKNRGGAVRRSVRTLYSLND